jgi:hypothetical protein
MLHTPTDLVGFAFLRHTCTISWHPRIGCAAFVKIILGRGLAVHRLRKANRPIPRCEWHGAVSYLLCLVKPSERVRLFDAAGIE